MVLRICDSQLMLPAFYLNLKQSELLSHIPGELANYITDVYLLNHERNKDILKQVSNINILLNQHGIFPIYLKGAAHLIDGLYEDIGERFMFDIDFIVRDDEILLTKDIFENDGYVIMKPYDPDNRFTMKHYPRMEKPGLMAGIEVHRLLSEIQYIGHFQFELIDPEKKMPSNSFTGCYVLSDNHKIIHNLINWQL